MRSGGENGKKGDYELGGGQAVTQLVVSLLSSLDAATSLGPRRCLDFVLALQFALAQRRVSSAML